MASSSSSSSAAAAAAVAAGGGRARSPPHPLPRFHSLVSVLALAVAGKRGPLARVLDAKLSVAEDIREEGGSGVVLGGGDRGRRGRRTGTYRTIDGLALSKTPFKFVLHSGMLFCFSTASSPDDAELVECLPLSLCEIAIDDGGGDASSSSCALSLSSASSGIWMVTLYFNAPAVMNVWRDAMEAASRAHVNAVSRSTPRPSHRGSTHDERKQRRLSHREWAKRSPNSTPRAAASVSEMSPRDVSLSVSELNQTRKHLVQHSEDIASRQGTFYQRLEAQSHVFGAEVSWRRLKLVDPSGSGAGGVSPRINPAIQDKPNQDGSASSSSSDTHNRHNRHGFHPIHHTRASAKERQRVAQDTSFFSSLKYHPRLRELALGDDSPQFQKHVAALQEQVRGVKHNSQKLLSSSAAYFSAGEAFCAAGHAFAQDMIRYAPYQRAEWQLVKGVLAMPAMSTIGGTGLNAKNEQKLSKDLGEDEARTRKLAIVTEELTLLMRESIVHLEVGLSQQYEALIKPLEHLIQVEAKSCKLSVERYEREKKSYLAVLSKFQGIKVKKGAKKAALKKDALQREAAIHAKIFEDARFEAALKLGSFDAVRDTRYLEQITQVRLDLQMVVVIAIILAIILVIIIKKSKQKSLTLPPPISSFPLPFFNSGSTSNSPTSRTAKSCSASEAPTSSICTRA